MKERKIVLVTRRTRLEELVKQYNTREQAKFIIQHSGGDFEDYVREEATYKQAVSQITRELEELAYVQILEREYVSNYIFGADDIVVAVGQDGLVANVMKYLAGQPLIGVNPDVQRYDGVLLPFTASDVGLVIKDVLGNRCKLKTVTLAKISMQDGQTLLGVNDIFIGQRTHNSARYILEKDGQSERQSSSGIIISTGLGSTGWLKSILAGAAGITESCQGSRGTLLETQALQWNSNFLYYTVREPYPSKWTQANLVFGKIEARSTFTIRSMMPENGVVFSDGMEQDFLTFNSGSIASITVADTRGKLVV